MGSRDLRLRQNIGISTTPAGYNTNYLTSVTLISNDQVALAVGIDPSFPILSLWDLFFTVVIDSQAQDSNGYFLYQYPAYWGNINQQYLSAGQLGTGLETWADYYISNDSDGIRTFIIYLFNPDTVSHTYYIYFKAYTFSGSSGTATGTEAISPD